LFLFFDTASGISGEATIGRIAACLKPFPHKREKCHRSFLETTALPGYSYTPLPQLLVEVWHPLLSHDFVPLPSWLFLKWQLVHEPGGTITDLCTEAPVKVVVDLWQLSQDGHKVVDTCCPLFSGY
jgi:hypothetical protein